MADTAAIRSRPSLAWPNMTYTYARPSLQTTTFDELTASGKLALVEDDSIRFAIGAHYNGVEHTFDRLDDRRTRIAWAAADIFSSTNWGSGVPRSLPEVDSTFFQAPNAEARFQRLIGPEFQGLLNQERIYAVSIEQISANIVGTTVRMLELLRQYQERIR